MGEWTCEENQSKNTSAQRSQHSAFPFWGALGSRGRLRGRNPRCFLASTATSIHAATSLLFLRIHRALCIRARRCDMCLYRVRLPPSLPTTTFSYLESESEFESTSESVWGLRYHDCPLRTRCLELNFWGYWSFRCLAFHLDICSEPTSRDQACRTGLDPQRY